MIYTILLVQCFLFLFLFLFVFCTGGGSSRRSSSVRHRTLELSGTPSTSYINPTPRDFKQHLPIDDMYSPQQLCVHKHLDDGCDTGGDSAVVSRNV